jgi:hypothetical protein
MSLLLAAGISHGQGMKIMPGTTFKLTGGTYNMVLTGNMHLENNAPVNNSTLVIKGTGASSSLRGTAPLTVANLLVNKTAGQNLQLQKNITVADGVTFTSGLLDLNGFDLVLADTAALNGESETSRVTGTGGAVQITQNLNAPLAENPGNLGLVITSGANWGSTVIRRSPAVNSSLNGGSSIRRSYQVTPANNTGLSTFLRMYYLDAELNALDENVLDFYRTDNGGTNWTNIGSASRNTTQNFVNVNGLQTMGMFTLSTTNNPLPIALSAFSAACVNNRAELQWRIDNPATVAFFRIDKSKDGQVWENIADQIKVQSQAGYTYTFTDVAPVYPYYRLQAAAPDGAVSYSPVQQVNCDHKGYSFRLVQNPVTDNRVMINVQAYAPLDEVALLVYDLEGRLLQRQTIGIAAGSSGLTAGVPGLAKGMYLVQIRHQQEILWQTKFIK